MQIIFLIVGLLFYCNTYSQILDYLPKGLGFELGLGYNQLKFQAGPAGPLIKSSSLSRDAFKLTPTFRLSWEKEIINNFSLSPFISYSIMGGKRNKKENGYEDDYSFRTLDFGLLASYKFYFITFAIGNKYNRFIKVTGKFYGSSNDPITTSREWNEDDMSWFFKKWSIDLGGRTSYSYYNFTIGLEGWFSITELINKDYEEFSEVNSKRFQILLGYRL